MLNKTETWCFLCAASLLYQPASNASVRIFGVADLGVEVLKAPAKTATASFENGSLMGNRLGIIGQEKLSEQYSVGFHLQQGFRLSDGAEHKKGKAFSRQSTLSVTTPIGEFAAGRTGALSSDCGTYAMLPPTATGTSFSAIGSVYSVLVMTARYDNTLVYRSPENKPLLLSLMYSNGTEGDEETRWAENNHYYGVGFQYEKSRLTLRSLFEVVDNRGKDSTHHATKIFTTGLRYKTADSAYSYFLYQRAQSATYLPYYIELSKLSTPNASYKALNQDAFIVGAEFTRSNLTIYLQANFAQGKLKSENYSNQRYRILSSSLSAVYDFSKQTALYTSFAYGAAYKALKTEAANQLRGFSYMCGLRFKF